MYEEHDELGMLVRAGKLASLRIGVLGSGTDRRPHCDLFLAGAHPAQRPPEGLRCCHSQGRCPSLLGVHGLAKMLSNQLSVCRKISGAVTGLAPVAYGNAHPCQEDKCTSRFVLDSAQLFLMCFFTRGLFEAAICRIEAHRRVSGKKKKK